MPCERYKDALTEAAAGEPVAPALAEHLGTCPACASELAALRRLMAAADEELSALATAEPSPALRARIREAVAAPAPALRWGFAWTATAAAVLALAVFGVWRASVARGPVSPGVAVNAPPPAPVPRSTAAPQSVANAAPSPAPVASTTGPDSARLPARSAHKAISVTQSVSMRRLRPAEPEVLVPAGELGALLQYVALVHQERAAPAALLALGQPSPDVSQQQLVIAPVEITPLDPAEAQGI